MRRIGISGNWRDDVSEHKLNDAYVRCIAENGGIPLVLPVVDNPDVIESCLDNVDALLLTGGGDIDPKYWGDHLTPLSNSPSVRRDTFDMCLTRLAVKRRMPVLGICRGMQALAIVSGGTIFQDIYSQNPEKELICHSQGTPRCEVSHEVIIQNDSLLSRIMGCQRADVNSFHHQAVSSVGSDCKVVAWSQDGIVEGIEFANLPIIAVQWHPEELFSEHNVQRRLFNWLVGSSFDTV